MQYKIINFHVYTTFTIIVDSFKLICDYVPYFITLPNILHYIALYYITLHIIAMHFITLHYRTLYLNTLHYSAVHYNTVPLYYVLPCITLHVMLHYIKHIIISRCISKLRLNCIRGFHLYTQPTSLILF